LTLGASYGSNGNHGLIPNGFQMGQVSFVGSDGTNGRYAALINVEVDGTSGTGVMPGRFVFMTTGSGSGANPTERVRITSNGATKMTNTGNYYTTNNSIHEMRVSNNNNWIALLTNTSTSFPHGISVRYTNNSPNDSSREAYHFEDSSALRFQVRSNGGIGNYQANNANLCDEREKKNIISLNTKWDKVKSWELKKFHYNEDADTDDLRYGVIAQQVEVVCPEVLTDWVKQKAKDAVLDEDGNVVEPAKEEILRKGVKEQQMMWMAIKALQEAQERIETLESKVAALEAG